MQHDLNTAATAKGWLVVKSTSIQACGAKAAGAIVISRIDNPHHPFAVHFFNSTDGGFYFGDYCANYQEADAAYSRKIIRNR